MSLPPPPSRDKDITGPAWQKWFSLLKEAVAPVSTGGKTLWATISKAGSRLTDIETRNHSDLQNLNSASVAHLTGSELTELTTGIQTNIHKHDHALMFNLNSPDHTHLTETNHTDLTDGGVTALHQHDFDNIVFPTQWSIGTFTHVYTLQELMNHEWSAGVVDGCDVTDNGDGTISIAAGVAVIRAVADGHTQLYGVITSAQANISLTDDATNYVYLDYNAGSPQFAVSTSVTSFNCMDKCIAYAVHRAGIVLHTLDAREQNVDSNRKMRQLFLKFARFIHSADGTVLGASGLAITVTSGSFFFMLQEITHDAFDTSVAGTANVNVFTLWYQDGLSGWTESINQKTITTTTYDSGTGTPATLGNNKYGVTWFYIINDSPSELHAVMGQAEYASISDARVASPPSFVPTIVSGIGSLIGFVVYEKSAIAFDNVYSAFSQTFTPGAATTHNGLSGIQTKSLLPNDNWHLSDVQATDLIDGGDSTLHYHASDRALANATGTLAIGNGGTGETTATAAFDALAPTTTQGDLIYHNGTDNVRLAKGTAAQVLTMNAGATAPEWAAAGAASVTTASTKLHETAVTQAAGALTIAGVSKYLDFRSATLTSGTPSTVLADPADLVIPSGATLGAITTLSTRLIIAEMNNAGTSEYAVCKNDGQQIDETNLITTTAIDTASDSGSVWYSTTARTNLPYRVVAYVDAVNTAGAWGDPTLVQPVGGMALPGYARILISDVQATTSGTSKDFVIPSWAKLFFVDFNGTSTNGTNDYLIQIGTGGTPATTGYLGSCSSLTAGITTQNFTAGFGIISASGANIAHGILTIAALGSNIYSASGNIANSNNAATKVTSGSIALAGVADILRITTAGGTDTFDAGNVSVTFIG